MMGVLLIPLLSCGFFFSTFFLPPSIIISLVDYWFGRNLGLSDFLRLCGIVSFNAFPRFPRFPWRYHVYYSSSGL
jgi:hypothetical protein